MKLVFLGTNGWYSNGAGNMICTLLVSDDCYVVFDAGDGIYKLEEHIKDDKPIYLFLSHLHLDHVCGFHIFPKFKFENKITIFCPAEERKMLDVLINHPFAMPFSDMRREVKITEVEEGETNVPFSLECRKLSHADHSYGYRLELENKTIVYCADTGICENDLGLARGADILIHECSNKLGVSSGKWGHSDPKEAAGLAKEAGCKKLILTHFSASQYLSNEDKSEAEKEARKVFENSWAAVDGMNLKV